ncbi:MAG: putative selenate reductase subunit YgfK, partial [Sphaerochaetaceae bacterium]|nr:putative selenate reductase subunit YgfK [Sphaerochaetaceae bacterium]
MADIMRPIPFRNLVERVVGELKNQKSIFGIHYDEFYHDKGEHKVPVFDQYCTMPLGPAAGPHTQLAQNIITSYLVGSRFIELKTVQIMDTLEIAKPCIDARDEGYNAEWSTEYTIPKAFDEYLKAWIIVHMLQCCQQNGEFTEPSFIFNMSVGYNLEGIKQDRMQWYIDSMIDCSSVPSFEEYKKELAQLLDEGLLSGTPYDGLEEKVKKILPLISPHISPNVTISTMHGCPPKEIEAICTYMLTEKHLDTFVKLNPTLLGYDMVRGILDDLGYGYVGLKRDTFTKDLQYPDAVSMLTRLIALGKQEKKVFGVKLTNTLGSVNDQGQLPGDEMYMSGRTLLPISTTVARKLSHEFGGTLPISYSGGANALTVKDLFETGIRPITLATDMLKPGGYSRLTQLAEILNTSDAWDMKKIDLDKLDKLNDKARDPEYIINKDFRGTDRVKIGTPLSLTDCYVAPCVEACPIHQDIPEYIQLMG